MIKVPLEIGKVYYLSEFTAPKVYNGLYFECLLTEQKIPSHFEVSTPTNIHITNWDGDIYKPERFTQFNIKK